MRIHIRETSQTNPTTFAAEISFDGGAPYAITVSDPFTAAEEERLAWYFEEWLQFPFINTVKAQKAADSITAYGEALFEQVIKADADAYSDYKEAIKHKGGFSQLEIAIEGSPAFHALHWEALKDPAHPTPLAVEAPVLRQNRHRAQFEAKLRPS